MDKPQGHLCDTTFTTCLLLYFSAVKKKNPLTNLTTFPTQLCAYYVIHLRKPDAARGRGVSMSLRDFNASYWTQSSTDSYFNMNHNYNGHIHTYVAVKLVLFSSKLAFSCVALLFSALC